MATDNIDNLSDGDMASLTEDDINQLTELVFQCYGPLPDFVLPVKFKGAIKDTLWYNNQLGIFDDKEVDLNGLFCTQLSPSFVSLAEMSYPQLCFSKNSKGRWVGLGKVKKVKVRSA